MLAYAVETCPDPSVKRTVDEISTAVGPKKETILQRLEGIRVLTPLFKKLPSVVAMMAHTG